MAQSKDIAALREKLRQQLPLLSTRYGVRSLAIFGSYVRRQEHEGSDLDVLVEFRKVPGLLTFVELENHLGDLLGVKVDLVMKQALKPRIGQRILEEMVPV
ncbi:MAG: nucleotidyltransferase family protein [Candidatus Latescibacteria bacterium]|nr:nucleotidyltransferase family protein [Candidatus Latescibacterota bacterium]